MIVFPWIEGDWGYVQNVWSRWQTLNAAMIAFGASLFVVYASQYAEREKRKHALIASRSMLPNSLSTLSEVAIDLSAFHMTMLDQIKKKNGKPENYEFIKTDVNAAISVLKECMLYAPVSDVKMMAEVVSMTQYLQSRTDRVMKYGCSSLKVISENELLEIAIMKSILDRLFNYARKLDSTLDVGPLQESEIINSLLNLEIDELKYRSTYNLAAKKYGKGNYDPSKWWT